MYDSFTAKLYKELYDACHEKTDLKVFVVVIHSKKQTLDQGIFFYLIQRKNKISTYTKV